MLDDWMDQHRAVDPAESSVPVSFHTFAWIEDEQAQQKSFARRHAKKPAKVVKTKRRNT